MGMFVPTVFATFEDDRKSTYSHLADLFVTNSTYIQARTKWWLELNVL